MTEEDLSEFFGDEEIKEHIEAQWHQVVEASSQIVEASKIFDFSAMKGLENPDINQIVLTMESIDSTMNVILMLNHIGQIHIDDTRKIYNIKQQILMLKQVAKALENDDRAAYDFSRDRLEKQAII